MQVRFAGVIAVLLVIGLGACTRDTQPEPVVSLSPGLTQGIPQSGAEPCPGSTQEPPSRGQRLIRGFLDLRDFPAPAANGDAVDQFVLGTEFECVLNAADGWASPNIRFDLAGGPDNDLFHVVLLTEQHLHNTSLGGCQNPQDDSCAQVAPGQPENRCNIVLKFSPGQKASSIAGVVYHELGHCFFGPQHSTDRTNLMYRQLPGERAQTARPSATQKAQANQRALSAEPIFIAP